MKRSTLRHHSPSDLSPDEPARAHARWIRGGRLGPWGKFRRLLVNLFLLGSSLVATLVGVELVLRALSPAPPMEHHTFAMQYDPLLGWSKIPNLRGRYVTAEYNTLEAFNSRGIRGPEYPYAKPAGEQRILVVGDSFAEGRAVEFPELFSEVLKETLNGMGGTRRVEVINAGTSGYSTDQELLYYQHEGRKYIPNLTIVMFAAENDVYYNAQATYWRGAKPLFKLEQGELRLTNVPVPMPEPPAPPGERPPGGRYLRHLWGSQLYGLLEQNMRRPVPAEFRLWERTYRPEMRGAWAITEALLVRLKAETAASGSRLLVFYIPSQAQIYPEVWRDTKRRYGMSDAEWDIDRADTELEAVCRRNAIDCINPTAEFRAEAQRLRRLGKRLYYPIDGHWNPEGHRLAGQILARYISERLLGRGSRKATAG